MKTPKSITLGLLVIGALNAGCEKQVSYSRDVLPILEAKCRSCHSPGGEGYAASGFSVESYRTAMKGTKYGAVIVPASSLSSTLVRLIEHKADPSIAMPRSPVKGEPSKWLTPQEIKLIETWIDEGAKDN